MMTAKDMLEAVCAGRSCYNCPLVGVDCDGVVSDRTHEYDKYISTVYEELFGRKYTVTEDDVMSLLEG